MRLKTGDAGAIVLFLAVVVFSIPWSAETASGQAVAVVESADHAFIMPLDKNDDLVLEGPAGTMVVSVRDREAFVSRSECREKICMSMGHISRSSEWIACLPNKVFVRISAHDSSVEPSARTVDVDAGAF